MQLCIYIPSQSIKMSTIETHLSLCSYHSIHPQIQKYKHVLENVLMKNKAHKY